MKRNRILNSLLALLVGLLAIGAAHAGTLGGSEFQAASDRFEGYATGYLAKAAAFGASGVGLVVSAFKQSLMPLGVGVGVGIFSVITAAIINSTFSAII